MFEKLTKVVAWLRGRKTYITYGVGVLISLAVAKGYLSPDVREEATRQIIDAIDGIAGILSCIGFIGAMFHRAATARNEKKVEAATGQVDSPPKGSDGDPTQFTNWILLGFLVGFGGFGLTGCAKDRYVVPRVYPSLGADIIMPNCSGKVELVSDPDPDVVAIDAEYRSNTTDVPDVAFSLDRPSTDTLKIKLRAKLAKNATPVEPAGAFATGSAIGVSKRYTAER